MINPISRLGRFPVPRQHGAWVMFLIPALMALILADEWTSSAPLLIVGFILIFLSHQPAGRFLRRWKYRKSIDTESLSWTLLLGGSGTILLAGLFIYQQQWLALLVGLAVAVALTVHLRLTLNKEHLSLPGEIVGVSGLTASAPIMYLYLHGSMDARGWVLWMINFLYFTASVFYIKLKLRTQPAQPEPRLVKKLHTGVPLLLYLTLVLLYVGIVTLIQGYSWYFFWAYVPFMIKAVTGILRWQDKRSLKPNRFGFVELAHSILFTLLAIAGFHNTVR